MQIRLAIPAVADPSTSWSGGVCGVARLGGGVEVELESVELIFDDDMMVDELADLRRREAIIQEDSTFNAYIFLFLHAKTIQRIFSDLLKCL